MSITAEDIKLRIVAENAADKVVRQFSDSVRHADRQVSTLSRGLKVLGGIAVGAFAVQGIRKVNDFLQDSIRLAQIQQDAEYKLATSIGYHSQALLDQASALQQTTTYGDEAIIQQQAYLAAIGMTERQIREMIPAALDLATGANMSLGSATKNLAKTYSGLTGELGESVGQLKTLSKEQLQAGEGVKLVAQIFQGQASSAAETYSGRLEQLSNKYGDLKEDVAEAILDSGAVEAALDSLNPAVDELTQYIVDHKDEIGEFAVGLVGMAVGAGKGAVKIAEELNPALTALGNSIAYVTKKADEIPGGWETLLGLGLGALTRNPIGMAIGASVGYISGLLFNLGRENEYVLGMKSKLYRPPVSGVRELAPDEFPYLQPENEVVSTALKSGGASAAKQREKEQARKRLNKLIEESVEWYKKETEAIEGLYEADKKKQESIYHLTVLRNADRISQDQYIAGIKRAEHALDMFYARNNAVLQADISSMIENNTELFGNFGDTVVSEADRIIGVADSIAVAYEMMSGSSIHGLNSLSAAIRSFNDTSGINNDLQGVLYAANFVGQNIGGGVGGAIQNTASMALAGSQIGSIIPGVGSAIGAAVGGVIGLASSLFGGGNDDANYEPSRRDAYDAIVRSALDVGPLALALAREGGWTYEGVKNMTNDTQINAEFGLHWEGRFLADHKDAHSVHMQEIIAAVDSAYMTINEVTKTSLSQQIEQTEAYYEYTKFASHELAEAERARIASLINTVTGISADSVADTMYDSIIDYTGYDSAGEAFADKMTDAARQAIVMMSISNLVNSMMGSVLEPLFADVAEQLIAGTLTASEMEALINDVEQAANDLAPAVEVLSDVLVESGVIADSTASDIDGLSGSINSLGAAAAQQQQLLLQYYRLTGDNEAIRTIELESVYGDNVALQEAIWGVMDAREAADKAYQVARQAASREQAEGKHAALDAYNAASDEINDSLAGARDSISELATFTGMLNAAAGSMRSSRSLTLLDYASARQYIRQALTIAQTLGFGSVDKDDLNEALGIVTEPSTNLYAEYVDYARDFHRTAIDIESLSDLADDSLSTEEKTLKALEDQLDTLRETYNDEIERLDALYEAQVKQIDELAGINTTNISIIGAIEALRAAYNALTEAEQEAARQAAESEASQDSDNAGDNATGGLVPPDDGNLSWDDLVAIRDSNVQAYVDSDDDLVTQMYKAFQDREPDAAGKTYWQNQIIGGMPVSEVISRWINSPEFAVDIASSDDPVAELYKRILLRPPDSEGYEYWSDQYASGTSVAQIAAAMLGSDEYDEHIRQVRGFATGGEHKGGWRVVGEQGPELEFTGPSTIRSSQQAQNDLGISELRKEIRALKNALNEQTEKLESYYDNWERKGLPTTTAA